MGLLLCTSLPLLIMRGLTLKHNWTLNWILPLTKILNCSQFVLQKVSPQLPLISMLEWNVLPIIPCWYTITVMIYINISDTIHNHKKVPILDCTLRLNFHCHWWQYLSTSCQQHFQPLTNFIQEQSERDSRS